MLQFNTVNHVVQKLIASDTIFPHTATEVRTNWDGKELRRRRWRSGRHRQRKRGRLLLRKANQGALTVSMIFALDLLRECLDGGCLSNRWKQQSTEWRGKPVEGSKERNGRAKEVRKGGNLHPGTSVSSLRGGTVSNVLAYFLAACRWAWRASISFLVLGMRHLKIQHSVITRERRGIKKDEFWGQLSEICFFIDFTTLKTIAENGLGTTQYWNMKL